MWEELRLPKIIPVGSTSGPTSRILGIVFGSIFGLVFVALFVYVAVTLCRAARENNAWQDHGPGDSRAEYDRPSGTEGLSMEPIQPPREERPTGARFENADSPPPYTFPPPPRVVVRGPQGDEFCSRPSSAPEIPAKNPLRYASLDAQSRVRMPSPEEGKSAKWINIPPTELVHLKSDRRQSPKAERCSPATTDLLRGNSPLDRPHSVVSITSTLYSSNASIHNAETQSVLPPEMPRMMNRLSDSAVLEKGNAWRYSPVRASM